jgi:hypothetical protein
VDQLGGGGEQLDRDAGAGELAQRQHAFDRGDARAGYEHARHRA